MIRSFLNLMSGLLLLSYIFFTLGMQVQDTKKTKVTTVKEVVSMSRECPDDVDGSHNNWYLASIDGGQITMSCTYTEEDK